MIINTLKNMTEYRTLVSKTALLISVGLMLGGCGGGSDTVANPFSGGNGGNGGYQGPAAQNDDVRAFEVNVWNNLRSENRCGQCHGDTGQSPTFVNGSDVNAAFSEAVPLVNLTDPSSSRLVTKVGAGHNCWESVDSVCADAIENMISAWSGVETTTTARAIELTAPVIKDPGESKTFPENADDNGANSFEQTVYPLLVTYCASCHYEEGSAQQQSPFFANPDDVNSSYAAAKSKINIDVEKNSRFVQRLLESHNCWSDCGTEDRATGEIDGDAGEMVDAIRDFASAITPTTVDPLLITSKAMTLLDGIVSTGGNRHEANQIALWEFKTKEGLTAFDTSGIEPSVNLSLTGNVTWLGAYGLDLKGGSARADTQTSRKLHDFIMSSGEYAIETWVIPANVTQEDANIISYDGGGNQKNFALTQTLFYYNHHNRSNEADANGELILSTEDAGEIVQSSLQHVVANYDPVNGRSIYVNGELIDVDDPISQATTLAGWDDTFALVMGKSSGNNKTWEGKIRMAAIHNRVLTQAQAQQNFEVGVGQKYQVLFSIGEQIGIPDSYILFEVTQFDDFGYLFNEPRFINLDSAWTPGGFDIRNLRIGINGKEAVSGQSFANLDVTIDGSYEPGVGQQLSRSGAVIALDKGPESDEFFLTFEVLGGNSNAFVDLVPTPPAAGTDPDPVSDIGIRTFEEINASIAAITQIPVTNPTVKSLYDQYRQQLPSEESIDAFLSSHQMAIAQLALTYCSERVEADAAVTSGLRAIYTDFDFSQTADVAFADNASGDAQRANAINPILEAVLLSGVDTSPNSSVIRDLLGGKTGQTLSWTSGSSPGSAPYDSLITQMLSCPVDGDPLYNEDFDAECTEDSNASTGINTTQRTKKIVKALCAATVGSAALLIQ